MADSSASPRLLLVDGFVYLHRAHHVHSHFQDSKGRPTGAMYGVINAIQRQMRRNQPQYAAVVLDAPGPTFRHEMYPKYKANRPPMDPDLKEQIEPLCEIIRALGLPLLREPGVEADDVIGTLSLQARADDMEVMILTADKDMAQLIEEGVVMCDADKPPMGTAEVEAKFQVPPERIIDYLTLSGDAADNIPGVPKVGPKTAAQWLARYGSLDGVVKNAGDIPGKIGSNLRDSLGVLDLYRELVTIRRDIPLPVSVSDLVPRDRDEERLRSLYERYGLRQFLRELEANSSPGGAPAASRGSARAYRTLQTLEELQSWAGRCREAGTFCVHVEYAGSPPLDAEIAGVALAVAPGQGVYVPFGHADADAHTKIDADETRTVLRTLLKDPGLTRIGHDVKTLRSVFACENLPWEGPAHDCMLESYVYRSTSGRHDLKTLARVYLEEEIPEHKEIVGSGKSQMSFGDVAVGDALPYVGRICDATFRLHQHLWPRLRKQKEGARLYRDLEMPMALVLGDMERVGMHIDVDELARQETGLQEALQKVQEEIFRECGHEFNLDATRDLAQVLYEERGLAPTRKTSTGAPSTSADVLEQLADRDVLPRMILEYRQYRKLLSTYVAKLPKMIHAESGRLHTSFQQAVTATGRLSSTNPNLQNIPIRTPEGRRVRKAFSSPPGRTLVAADYSQIELRIMAHISEDPGLCDAFGENRDVHQATAAEVFGVVLEDVTQEQRRSAKAINFGLMYGMGAFGLSRGLSFSTSEAQAYITRYFERYPKVKEYMDRTRETAREQGYVETVWGRRLYVDGIQARNPRLVAAAQRAAINAPMQGTAADIIKRAMVDLHGWLRDHHPDCRIVLQVHDELVLEVPEEKAPVIRDAARERMESAAQLRVPLVVDAGCGTDWNEAHG